MRLIPLLIQSSRLLAAITFIAGAAGPSCAELGGAQVRPAGKLALPMYFEANRGQTDASVKFFTRAAGYSLYLTAAEAVTVLPKAAASAQEPGVVRMKLKGANAKPAVRGMEILPGHTNYILGNDPSKWQNGVKHYAKVHFGQVYPGIDMVYRFDKGQVEYDFVVTPGANPGRILIGFEGAKSLRLDQKGNLVLGVESGELTYKAPELYQRLGSRRVPVKGRFVLASNNNVRFEVGNYIKSKELVIDPAVSYSSFLGGALDDTAYAIAVDTSNNAYLTGSTLSTDFPSVAGSTQPAKGVGTDVFVSKINAAGTTLLWSTYLGGAGDDIGLGIAVDGGKVYVTGSTTGTMPGRTLIGPGGGTDAFVVALNTAGTATTYRVQFGGAEVESGNGIAVDAEGNAYVTGVTGSIAIDTFPTTPLSAQPLAAAGAQTDAFVAKFNAAGAQVYATYLGGTGADKGNAIAVDTAGNAYITGQCGDAFVAVAQYPEVFKNTVTGPNDAFIVKLDPEGANFVYKTYAGGSGIDDGTGIAVDSSNNVYITGYTYSADFPGKSFVTIGQTTIGTAPDAFVFKLRPFNGGGIKDGLYATYLGASGEDRATAIAVDSSGNAYVTGRTYSGDFPMVGPIAGGGTLVGSLEAFVTQIGPTGGSLGFSTYLGGTGMTRGQGIALDSAKNIYVTGWTGSAAATFLPVSPFQAGNAGSLDSFIAKFGPVLAPPAACTILGINPGLGFSLGGTTVTITGTGFVSYSGPGGVTFDGINAQGYTVNSASTVITAIAPRHPVLGPLAAGSVPLRVTTTAGSCSASYNYILMPATDNGTCGEDFFFPSPATGDRADFAYCMASPGTVRIRIYNVVGDLAVKLEYAKGAGAQLSTLNTGRMAPGVYLYSLEKDYDNGTSSRSSVKKFVVKH